MSRPASIALVVAILATRANAEPPGLTPLDPALDPAVDPGSYPEPPMVNHDYRRTMVIADAAGVLLTGLAFYADDPYALVDGLMFTVVSGPTVHMFKRNWSGALRSVGLRIGLPILGGWIGDKFRDPPDDSNCDDACTLGHVGQGIGVGVLAAVAIDWFEYAHVSRRAPRTSWSPVVARTPDRTAIIGVTSTF